MKDEKSTLEEKSVNPNHYTIHHMSVNDTNKWIKFDIDTIIIQPDQVRSSNLHRKPNFIIFILS